jgi:hypothetical protein
MIVVVAVSTVLLRSLRERFLSFLKFCQPIMCKCINSPSFDSSADSRGF